MHDRMVIWWEVDRGDHIDVVSMSGNSPSNWWYDEYGQGEDKLIDSYWHTYLGEVNGIHFLAGSKTPVDGWLPPAPPWPTNEEIGETEEYSPRPDDEDYENIPF